MCSKFSQHFATAGWQDIFNSCFSQYRFIIPDNVVNIFYLPVRSSSTVQTTPAPIPNRSPSWTVHHSASSKIPGNSQINPRGGLRLISNLLSRIVEVYISYPESIKVSSTNIQTETCRICQIAIRSRKLSIFPRRKEMLSTKAALIAPNVLTSTLKWNCRMLRNI